MKKNTSPEIDNLKTQVDSLKAQFSQIQDSLAHINYKSKFNEIDYKLNQNLDIITKVNEFYDSAWIKLVLLIGALGVFVPFIIQYFQRISNKQIFDKSTQDFEIKMNEIQKKNLENFEQLSKNYNEEIQVIKDSLRNSNDRLIANTFFLQGRLRINESNHKYALKDFVHSATKFLSVNRIQDANTALVYVLICLENIPDKKTYDEITTKKNINWEKFLYDFKDSSYLENVNKIKSHLAKYNYNM